MSGVELGGHPRRREYGPIAVRTISRTEARDAIHLLALSFVDEPGLRHVLGGTPRRRSRVLIPFMWAGLRSYPRSVEIHGAWLDGTLAGVGLRMPPGAWPVGRWQTLNGWAWGLLGALPMLVACPQAVRVFRAASQQQRHHPGDRPHWYLWTMGVHPSFRRRGVASALARFVIEQADAEGVGCYLETYGDGTEALYRRLGFEVRDRWEVGPGAPLARTMWRKPRPRACRSSSRHQRPLGCLHPWQRRPDQTRYPWRFQGFSTRAACGRTLGASHLMGHARPLSTSV